MSTPEPSTRDAARERLADDLARVGTGDRAAMRRVYAATSAKLFGICLRFAPDREAAEDALQETFVKVWRNAARFDRGRASPITWLSLIARGTAIDHARAAGRRREDAEAPAGDIPAADPPVDRAVLDDCVQRLAENARTAILSAFLDGYAYSELADRERVPLGTMKSRIRRGLMALRSCLEDG